jgi:hypothetical protein
VHSYAASTVLVSGALLFRPVQPKHQEWSRSLSLPQPQAFAGTICLVDLFFPRVDDHGQLTLFARFVNLLSLVCRLGATKSGQFGTTGDVPQREAALPYSVEVQ